MIQRVTEHGLQQLGRATEKDEGVFCVMYQENSYANCKKIYPKDPQYFLIFLNVDKQWLFIFIIQVLTDKGKNQGSPELFGLYFSKILYLTK